MLIMGSSAFKPHEEIQLRYLLGENDALRDAVINAEAFGRSVAGAVGDSIYSTAQAIAHYNPVSVAIRNRPGISQLKSTTSYLTSTTKSMAEAVYNDPVSATRTVNAALDKVNPVSVAIRQGPWYVSMPLQLAREETQACLDYLAHPVQSATELVDYMYKKPSRIAKMMRAVGVDIPPEVITMIKFEDDLNKMEQVFPVWMEKGIDAAKIQDKNIARYRGKILLSILKAITDNGGDLEKDVERYLVGMLESSATRALSKSMKTALKDKPVKINKPQNAALESYSKAVQESAGSTSRAESNVKEEVCLNDDELEADFPKLLLVEEDDDLYFDAQDDVEIEAPLTSRPKSRLKLAP